MMQWDLLDPVVSNGKRDRDVAGPVQRLVGRPHSAVVMRSFSLAGGRMN